MAQYFTDFTESIGAVSMPLVIDDFVDLEYPSSAFPLYHLQDAWVQQLHRWRIVDLNGEKVIRNRNAGGPVARYGLFWYKPGAFQDVIVECKVLHVSSNEKKRPSVIIKGSGDATKETGYVFQAHYQNDTAAIHKYAVGTTIAIQTVAFTYTPGIWYNIKAEATGSTLRMKVWPDGSAEPGSWTVTATDSSIGTGYCGIFDFDNTGDSYFKDLRVIGTPVFFPDWFFGWTRPVNSVVPAITSAKTLRMFNATTTVSSRKALFYRPVVASDVVEIRTRVKSDLISNGVHLVRFQCAGVLTETGYFVAFLGDNGGLRVGRYRSGEFYSLSAALSEASFPVSVDEWFNLRVKVIRSTKNILVKAWKDSDTEPEDWQVSAIDDHPTLMDIKGFVGVGSFSNTASPNSQFYDFFGVGTEGDPAPHGAVV